MSLVLTPEEYAREKRVSVNTVRRWCRDGVLPAIKVGRQWRIPAHALPKLSAGKEENDGNQGESAD